MEFVKGIIETDCFEVSEIKAKIGQVVKVKGMVHKIREMSDFAFIILRTKRDLIQCVYSKDKAQFDLSDICEETGLLVEGEVVADERATIGFEIQMHDVKVLSKPKELLPIIINKKALDVSLDVNLNNRPISLRNPRERAIFKVQEGIARGFREYLQSKDFTEIHTPKIVFAGAEGGANIFKLDYFGKKVFLTQSPQFYKQMMVGVFERVFEIADVYRAEKHDTSRHINEYISMDLEMGFINSFVDIMNIETGILKYIMNLLEEEYSNEIKLLNVTLPKIEEIPSMKFMDAKKIITDVYKKKITDYHDFEPEEEQLIGEYAKKQYNSDFMFITHYPSAKRPFYAMDDKNDPGFTLSFDLIYNGLEVTTGGQRIHDYDEQVKKMTERDMNIDDFESYLMIHKHGMPPHGGLGAGLERLTAKLLGYTNVRNATLFPRDINRVTP